MSETGSIELLLSLLSQPAATLADGLGDRWRAILECAEEQHMSPMLYYVLRGAGLDQALPSEVLGPLREAFHANAAGNLALFEQLGAVIEALGQLGVRVIVLKGAFLAQAVYPNPALRRMGDLDILVRADDLPRAVKQLAGLGYRPVAPPWVNVGSDIELISPDRLAKLELHWGLTGVETSHQIPVNVVWKTATSVSIAGQTALALAPEELLLHLCYHAAHKHLFMQGLRSLVDVDQTVRRYGQTLDWQRLAALAGAWGLQRGLALTFALCQQYLATPIQQAAAADSSLEIRPEIKQEVLARLSLKEQAVDVARANLFHVRAQRGLVARTRLLLGYAFRLPPRPDMQPNARAPFATAYYTVRRLIYLVAHYSGTLWRMLQIRRPGGPSADRTPYLLAWLEA